MTISFYVKLSTISAVIFLLPSMGLADEGAPALAINAEVPAVESKESSDDVVSEKAVSSSELVRQAWEASAKNEEQKLNEIVDRCMKLYGSEAKLEAQELSAFPSRGREHEYQSLNDVGTCNFIQAEFLMNHGKTEEAKALFEKTINEYKWALAWDPSRGSFWSVAEKSQDSIDVLTGKREEELENEFKKVERTIPTVFKRGTQNVIEYAKYGKFLNVGTEDYKYSISDVKALSEAIGEGIYPNTSDVYNNPRRKELQQQDRLKGSHWDYVNIDDLEAAYFKWVTAPEPLGIRLFYLGVIFEKAKLYHEALKAYHALVVHFPRTVAWTYWQTPWYPAQAAIAKIRYILRTHPELNLTDKYMKIEVRNGYDNDTKNDVIITYPGKILPKTAAEKLRDSLGFPEKKPLGKVKKTIGEGKVRLVQYENNHWQLLVEDKPYIIKGITYAPTKIGQSPDKGTLKNWMTEDNNENGKPDGPYDSWVDTNGNNTQDDNEPVVGDMKLLKDMGVNTIRIYNAPEDVDKELLRTMYNEYGIRFIVGNFLGKYAIGSGATWSEGTDYENPQHRANMLEAVKKMVMTHKDEPYVLMWLLGNENNYGVASNADKKPQAYYKFVDEVALWIKSVDKDHPIAISNGDTLFLDIFGELAPNVDIFAANIYRGDYGFGSLWEQVADATGKPAFITEFGCPAYAKHLSVEEAEEAQANYHKGNWMDIQDNLAGTTRGVGNALGGVVFEWMDEWWKNYEPFVHDRKSDAIGPFPGGYYFEEWFGLVSQGNGTKSPFLRHLRKAYFVYQDYWNKI